MPPCRRRAVSQFSWPFWRSLRIAGSSLAFREGGIAFNWRQESDPVAIESCLSLIESDPMHPTYPSRARPKPLTIFNGGGYVLLLPSVRGAVCQEHEISRWRRADRAGAGAPRTGAAGGRGA